MTTEIKNYDEKISKLRDFMGQSLGQPRAESQLIAILHKAQNLFGYLPQQVMDEVSLTMNIPTAHIWGVATFYHYFSLKPKGRYQISVCLGTACYVKGAAQVLETIKKELGIGIGQTTQDQLFTLSETRCLGTCGLAPVVMINDKIYGTLTPKKIAQILQDIKKDRQAKPES